MISQGTSYAIFAMTRLQGPDGNFRLVREIAKEADMPPDYLAKIFNMLRKRGLLEARRGVNGGVRLAVPLSKISLFDVCEALEDEFLMSKCMLGLPECSETAPCPVHNFWKNAKQLLLNELQNIGLPQVVDSLTKRGMM